MSEKAHPDEHLQWYVNGTLEGDERATVESHLQSCERCRAEVEFLRVLHRQVKSAYRESIPTVDDLALRRLLSGIAKEQRRVRAASNRWKLAFAAAVVVLAVQTVVFIPAPQPDVLVPLGGPSKAGRGVLQIQFQPTATETRIREVLGSVNARLVDGPSAIGIYRIRVAEAARADDVIRQLESESDVVAHVFSE